MRKQRVAGLVLFAIISLIPILAAAQGQPSFEASADARQILLRSFVEVTFTLHNGEGNAFEPPSFKDFIIASGPSRSVSTTIINGQFSSESGYNYTLQPKKTGKLQIGAASIRVNGKTLRTSPITIEVLDSKQAAGNDKADPIFMRAIASTEDGWVGQQILLDYKLYYSTDQVGSYNPISESSYQGFYALELKRYNAPMQREIINGRQYFTKVIRRVALFPQQSGDFVIEPFEVQLNVTSDNPRSSGFFFNRQTTRVPAATQPLTIHVKSLPTPAPPAFSGAVGRYFTTFGFNQNDLTTDDALSLRLAVSGDGDLKRVQAPNLTFPDAFEVYPPKTIQDNSYEDNGKVLGERIFEYLLVPRTPGTYTLTPSFSYYDADSTKYATLTASAATITVRQGSNRPNTAKPTQSNAATQDIRYLKKSVQLKSGGYLLWGQPLLGILILMPVAGVGMALLARQNRRRRDQRDPLELRRQHARKVALQRLSGARTHLDAGQSRAFYDEVAKTLVEFVCHKLNIPLSAWSKDHVRQHLESIDVQPDIIDRFTQVMQTCEMALFAGKDNAADMQHTFNAAEAVIIGIEQAAGQTTAAHA